MVQSWYKLFFFSNYDNLWRMIRRIVTVDLRRILVTRINKQGNKKNVALDEKIYARYARDNRLPRDPWKSSLESFFPSRPTSMKKGSPSKIFFVRPSLTPLNYRRPLFSLIESRDRSSSRSRSTTLILANQNGPWRGVCTLRQNTHRRSEGRELDPRNGNGIFWTEPPSSWKTRSLLTISFFRSMIHAAEIFSSCPRFLFEKKNIKPKLLNSKGSVYSSIP